MANGSDEEGEVSGIDILGSPLQQDSDTAISLGAQTPALLEPGAIVLDKFRIIEPLGKGGMGSVYRVEHLLMNRQFALKCLNKFQAADASWRRFQNEARAAHLLDHPNLLKVYEFGLLPGGQPFFLMELIEGVTLADEIKRLGRLPLERAIKVFIQVAFAIGYAHENRVIHRDLKPSNIMLVAKKLQDDPEVVKVVDFGIAKLTGIDEFNQQTLTKTGEIFGSPLYMSPEQCVGVGVDQRSDLYSLGCVFYETLTGAPPFMGESALSTMMKHQSESQLTLKEASLGMLFPQGLEDIVTKLLEKDPQQRYQSGNQLAADLMQVERSLDVPHQPTQTQGESIYSYAVAQKPEEKRTLEFVSVAVAACLFGIIACFVIMHQVRQSELDSYIASGKALSDQNNSGYELTVAKCKQWSRVEDGKRTFYFPLASIGKIVLANGEAYEASGTFTVPSYYAVGLIANENLVRHPEFMDKFKPGEITVFDLNALRTANAAFFAKFASMPGLKALNLYNTSFGNSDLKTISKLDQLLYLNLGFSDVTGAEILKYAPLRNLNSLDLTSVDDAKLVIPKLSELPRLRQIALGCDHCHAKELKELAKAQHLKIIDVSFNGLQDDAVAELTRLKNLSFLNLTETRVSPDVWKYLIQMPNLHRVTLGNFHRDLWPAPQKRYFEAQMAKYAPQVEISWLVEDNLDYSAGSTDLRWLGLGMQSHKSPIFGLVNDGDPTRAPGLGDRNP